MSIESTPIAEARRRWLSERLRAIRYSHGRTLIGRSSASTALKAAAKHLLQYVLGVLARAQHVPAEGQQAGVVAGEERLEGGVLAATRKRDQTLVGLQAQQRAGPS